MTEQPSQNNSVFSIGDKAWSRIPPHCRRGLKDYLDFGIIPSDDFLQSILTNDYRLACMYADETNKGNLYAYFEFLYQHAPVDSWGSESVVDKWSGSGGLSSIATTKPTLQTIAEPPRFRVVK